MEDQQAGKRTLTLPITLVLLVFSLIGNVFLFSQYLQGKQDEQLRTGQHIIETAQQAAANYNALINEAAVMLELNEKGVYTDKLQQATGAAGLDGAGAAAFIAEAKSIKGEAAENHATAYFAEIRKTLDALHGRKEPYTEADKQSLTALRQSLESQAAIIAEFDFDAAESRSSTLQIATGIGWLELADQLETEMSK
ncbi:hypothetical protein GOM71_12075 [Paenibacillus sp. NEAU-GSW1]|nr:hypothetical protein [Paenibacillus sp. NEAU-GSW1]